MENLNEFLKKNDLYLTLVNDHEERYDAGPADYIKPYNSKTVIRWEDEGKFSNTFPFTYAVLHNGRSIFETRYIRPVFFGKESVIELVYS